MKKRWSGFAAAVISLMMVFSMSVSVYAESEVLVPETTLPSDSVSNSGLTPEATPKLALRTIPDNDDNNPGSKADPADAGIVKINEVNFPDPVFRSLIAKGTHYSKDSNGENIQVLYDQNGDGWLSAEEIADVKQILVPNMKIKSLQGIGYFTSVIELQCQDNWIKSLDVSNLEKLEILNCFGCKLEGTLDLSNNINLTGVSCHKNGDLTGINVSNCINLTSINIELTGIETIDLSENLSLESISCAASAIKTLDVSKNKKLRTLSCYSTAIKELDVSKNPNLLMLDCSNTSISSLDLSNNKLLNYLVLNNTDIEGLELSQNPALKTFRGSNTLAWVNFRDNSDLSAKMYISRIRLEVDGDYFDITKAFPGINPKRISIVSGAELDGNVVSGYDPGKAIVYRYYCGRNSSGPIYQKVILLLSENAVVPDNPFGDEDTGSGTAATGDEFPWIPLAVLTAAAGTGAVLCIARRKPGKSSR